MTMIRSVPLGALHIEYGLFKNPRTVTGLGKSDLEEMIGSFKETDGPLIRPEVIRAKADNEDGFVNVVWDGQRRVLAGLKAYGKSHEIEVIDATGEILDLDDPKVADELEDRALEVGTHRKELSSYELVELAIRKRDERGKKLGAISEALKRSESWCSKFMTAWDKASDKVKAQWRDGELTDEQFREIAVNVKDADDQESVAKEVIQARESGDIAGAREKVKEIAETAKQKKAREKREREEAAAKAREDKKAAREAKKNKGKKPVVSGDQQDMFAEKKAKAEPKKPAAPAKHELESFVEVADKKAPTHDYVKGLFAGVRYALGLIDPDAFAKPYRSYMNKVMGIAAKSAKSKPAKKPAKRKR